MELFENQIFDGKYKIIRIIGQGGMGKVYLAQNIKLGTLWAIKEVSKQTGQGIDLLAEPNIMKRLKHPSLPRIFDIIENEEAIYIILDYVEGDSLDKALQAGTIFSEEQVVEWAKKIGDVLQYLHELKPHPIIYRDMKPSNLMNTLDGDIKVIDFGIAREFKHEANSDTMYLGTRGYAAPEQFNQQTQTDARTDIYSLGVTLYHLVTGKGLNEPPYEIRPIREWNSALSEGLEYIILKCTQQNPNDRYQNVRDLKADLERLHEFSAVYKKQKMKYRLKLSSTVASLLFFACLTLAGVKQFDAEQVQKYDELVSEGAQATNKLTFKEAEEKLTKAISFKPDELAAYQEYGRLLYEKGEYEKLISYLQNEVLSVVPGSESDGNFFYLLGKSAIELKDYEQAIVELTKAIHLAPRNSDYYEALAISYAKKGNFKKAESTLTRLEKLKIDKAASWYVKGEIATAQKKYEQAAASLQKAIDLGTDEELMTRSYISLAQLYNDHPSEMKDNGSEKRLDILEKANNEVGRRKNIQITEMLAQAYYDRGKVLENRSKEFNQALNEFQALLDMGYNRPYIYLNQAIIYQTLQQYEKSEKKLIEMKKQYPDNYRAYSQLAFLYAEREGKKPESNRNYRQVVENYNLALKYSPNGAQNPELQPLTRLMEELKAKGWLNEEGLNDN